MSILCIFALQLVSLFYILFRELVYTFIYKSWLCENIYFHMNSFNKFFVSYVILNVIKVVISL